MLHHGIKKTLIAITLAVICFACTNREGKSHEQTLLYTIYSERIAGENYTRIYKMAKDTLENWKLNHLKNFQYLSLYPFHLDSLICFNKERNKMISAILVSDTTKINNTGSDALSFFYGIEINSKWYFFSGATVVLPREIYQKDMHTPLSFAKLHEIAMKEVFSGYLIKKKKYVGFWKNIFAPEYEYEINDNFFSELDRIVRDAREQEEKYHGRSFKSTEEYMDWFAKYSVEVNWHKK